MEIPHEGPFADLMWSDPDPDNQGFTMSSRGAGYMFGKDVVDRFLHENNMQMILRAHQLVMEGYQLIFNDKFATVWSAPNYCYRFENQACVLELDENLNKHFNMFSDAPENKQKREQDARMYGGENSGGG